MARLAIGNRTLGEGVSRPTAILAAGAVATLAILLTLSSVTTVPPGHNQVASLFGEVQLFLEN